MWTFPPSYAYLPLLPFTIVKHDIHKSVSPIIAELITHYFMAKLIYRFNLLTFNQSHNISLRRLMQLRWGWPEKRCAQKNGKMVEGLCSL